MIFPSKYIFCIKTFLHPNVFHTMESKKDSMDHLGTYLLSAGSQNGQNGIFLNGQVMQWLKWARLMSIGHILSGQHKAPPPTDSNGLILDDLIQQRLNGTGFNPSQSAGLNQSNFEWPI